MTVVELLVVAIGALIVAAVLMPAIGPRRHGCNRQMKDATQVRGIQQSLAIWANQNKGLYVIPSRVDLKNATVADLGTAKDTTANILSILIYTGGISVDLVIAPSEVNYPGIQLDDDYEFDNPEAAVDPANALWDPAFAADFTGGKIGNTSYAHIVPSGRRWQDTFTTTEPVIGNRGPQIASVSRDASGKLKPVYVNRDSNTFLIHGSRRSWEGNVAYNDNHVNFETRLDPDGVTYRNAAGQRIGDCMFFDEPDDPDGVNAFISIWTKAGDSKGNFEGIWD